MKIALLCLIYSIVGLVCGISNIGVKSWQFYVILVAMAAIQIITHFMN